MTTPKIEAHRRLYSIVTTAGGVIAGIKADGKNPLTTRPKTDADGDPQRASWDVHRDEGHLAKGVDRMLAGECEPYLVPGSVPVHDGWLACADGDAESRTESFLAEIAPLCPPLLVYRKPSNPLRMHIWMVLRGSPGSGRLYAASDGEHVGDIRGRAANTIGVGMKLYPGEADALASALQAALADGFYRAILPVRWERFTTKPREHKPTTGVKTVADGVAKIEAAASGRYYVARDVVAALTVKGLYDVAADTAVKAAFRGAKGTVYGDQECDRLVDEAVRGAQAKIDSGEWTPKKGSKKTVQKATNDKGMSGWLSVDLFARAFVEQYGNVFRNDPRRAGRDAWLQFRDGVWHRMDAHPVAAARQIVTGFCDSQDEPAAAHSSWSRSGTYSGILSCAAELLHRPLTKAMEDGWDPDPHLLGLPGGLVSDLRTGDVRGARPDDYVTRVAGAVPADTAGDWPDLLDVITLDDQEMVEWLGALAADCAFGESGEDLLVAFEGKPGTGKTTVAGAIHAALGDYAEMVQADHLLLRQHDEHPAWIARLDGARMVLTAEPPGGRHWNASLVSQLSGGDPLEARFMRRDPFEFLPRFRMVMACNSVPPLPEKESLQAGLRRRMRVVPFEWNGHEGGQADERLRYRFHRTPEGRGEVLRWILDSARHFLDRDPGFRYPECARIRRATNAYIQNSDIFGAWMTARVALDPDGTMTTEEAFQSAKAWQEKTRSFLPTRSFDSFAKELRRRLSPAVPKLVTHKGRRVRGWRGWTLEGDVSP